MSKDDRRQYFLELADKYKSVIAKVCSVYSSASIPFADLYQEVMINLWSGLDSFRGDSKMSTWIYRLALNTCITMQRHSRRHHLDALPIEAGFDIPDNQGDADELRTLYALIARLDPVVKALITLWLDEKSYDEISAIIGISKANVATRLFRAKQRLSHLANDE
ncbi:MAG: RNA polymerase sigma factor [Muribaculaceae bacterium]|nr:RNA polymerase sigma factor [Muribaculaceae bacterium]